MTAVVLTYRRPRLAGDVVRALLADEGLAPGQVIVVVNGEGGLDDPALEAAVRMVRLPVNTGPAGGFRAGLEAAAADPGCHWVYLCEDDVGLFDLPSPRLADLVARAEAAAAGHPASEPSSPTAEGSWAAAPTPSTWSRAGTPDWPRSTSPAGGPPWCRGRVVDAGVLPDPDWFFGVEDFDFFCRVRAAGFEVLVDGEAARAVAGQQTNEGRDEAIRDRPAQRCRRGVACLLPRPQFAGAVSAPRHPSWVAWHLAYSARHLQAARQRRRALGHRPRAVGRGPSPPRPQPGLRAQHRRV